jgi:hypothetical protein
VSATQNPDPNDFIDETPNGDRLNRERYNAYLLRILTDDSVPETPNQRQRNVYKALANLRYALADLSDEDFKSLFVIESGGKSYITQVRDEIDNSLAELQKKILAGAVFGEADRVPIPTPTTDPSRQGGNLLKLLDELRRLGDDGFEISCGDAITNPRFECIVTQTRTQSPMDRITKPPLLRR